MQKKKIKILASNLMKLGVIALLPLTAKMQGYAIMSLVVLGIYLGLYLFPKCIKKQNKDWGENIDFWLSFTMLFNTMGYAFDLFDDAICVWWDEFSHFFSFVILGLFIIYFVQISEPWERRVMNRKRPDFIIFILLIFIGFLWEGIEFSFDHFWDLGMQPSRSDTWNDIQLDALGAFLIVLMSFKKGIVRDKIFIKKIFIKEKD